MSQQSRSTSVSCPICSQKIPMEKINSHIDRGCPNTDTSSRKITGNGTSNGISSSPSIPAILSSPSLIGSTKKRDISLITGESDHMEDYDTISELKKRQISTGMAAKRTLSAGRAGSTGPTVTLRSKTLLDSIKVLEDCNGNNTLQSRHTRYYKFIIIIIVVTAGATTNCRRKEEANRQVEPTCGTGSPKKLG